MRRLGLLVGLTACLLSSCGLPTLLGQSAPTVLPPDPFGATLTQIQGPNYTTLEYLPGKSLTRQTVAYLVGPALRVNDVRCVTEPSGLACTFGTVEQGGRRVIYVTGYGSATLKAVRDDGTAVSISAR